MVRLKQQNRIRKLVIVICTIIAAIIGFWLIIRVPDEPQSFPNIPKDAVWKGGVDRGFWYSVVSLDTVRRTVRLRIYNDYDGHLAMDANYQEQNDCIISPFNKEAILQNIFDYGFQDIEIKGGVCKLKIIKPAFGGELSTSIID